MNFQSAPSRRSLRSNPSNGVLPTKRSTCHFARNNMFSGHLQNQSMVVRALLPFIPSEICLRARERFSVLFRYMEDQFVVHAQIIETINGELCHKNIIFMTQIPMTQNMLCNTILGNDDSLENLYSQWRGNIIKCRAPRCTFETWAKCDMDRLIYFISGNTKRAVVDATCHCIEFSNEETCRWWWFNITVREERRSRWRKKAGAQRKMNNRRWSRACRTHIER